MRSSLAWCVNISEADMRLPVAIALLTFPAMTILSAQLPGDRPAGNPRGTRSPVLARNGVIATSQPLASAAGLQVMQEGGNAIDAAVTAAAVLAVVEPTMTGIGGDVFAIVYDARTKQLRGLNSSGRAGAKADADMLVAKGNTTIPGRGAYPVTVPGALAGWAELLEKHGTISLARALAPAIRYARDGYPVSEIIAGQWENAEKKLSEDPAAAAVFLPGGHAPKPGEVFRNPDLARTLEQVAKGGRDVFYKGAIARLIADDLQSRGGFVTAADRRRTRPTGSSRSARTIAATTCTRSRQTPRASSRSRCSTSSRDSTSSRSATTRPTTCTCSSKRSGLASPIARRTWRTRITSRRTC
jgi:hypothetical protein